MQHKWGEAEWFMDTIYSTCEVCGGVRVRERIKGMDYVNTGGISIDIVVPTRKGWRYEDTPRSCPGTAQESSEVERE